MRLKEVLTNGNFVITQPERFENTNEGIHVAVILENKLLFQAGHCVPIYSLTLGNPDNGFARVVKRVVSCAYGFNEVLNPRGHYKILWERPKPNPLPELRDGMFVQIKKKERNQNITKYGLISQNYILYKDGGYDPLSAVCNNPCYSEKPYIFEVYDGTNSENGVRSFENLKTKAQRELYSIWKTDKYSY